MTPPRRRATTLVESSEPANQAVSTRGEAPSKSFCGVPCGESRQSTRVAPLIAKLSLAKLERSLGPLGKRKLEPTRSWRAGIAESVCQLPEWGPVATLSARNWLVLLPTGELG